MDLQYLEVDETLQWYHAVRARCGSAVRDEIDHRFLASWIHHDLSIEGLIFRDNELLRGLEGRSGANWSENRLLNKVRQLRQAIDFITVWSTSGKPFDLEFVKDIHRQLCEEDDEAAGRYRKDSGPSTAYRHDIVAPTGISYHLRKLIADVEENGRHLHPISMACRIHRQIMEVFPFQEDNGIVARLAMNAWLLRHGYPSAVFLANDRHRYFGAYLAHPSEFRNLVVSAMNKALDAKIRLAKSLQSDTKQVRTYAEASPRAAY
ncbi:MAG: Fic family protein [Myxococcales bacterium]|nr:Fic family protein [Myxococcales bacterium]